MTPQTPTPTATELVSRLNEIAHRVEAASVAPVRLDVDCHGEVSVQCWNADDVDAIMELLDDGPEEYRVTSNYTRWGLFDGTIRVIVFSPRRPHVCESEPTATPSLDAVFADGGLS